MQENTSPPLETLPTTEPQKLDLPHFLKSKKAKVISLTLLVIFFLLLTSIIGLNKVMQTKRSIPFPPIPTPSSNLQKIKYCTQDSDCVIAINSSSCCFCPEALNRSSIGKDGWILFEEGKNYQRPIGCTDVVCESCQRIENTICQNNTCISESDATTIQIKDWKTYINDNLKLSLRHPPDLKIEEYDKSFNLQREFISDPETYKNNFYLSVRSENNPEQLTPEEYILQQCQQSNLPTTLEQPLHDQAIASCIETFEKTKQPYRVNNLISLRAQNSSITIFPYQDQLIIFSLGCGEEGAGINETCLNTLNQILSTIQFLD